MTSQADHGRWWFGLRGLAFFLVGGGFGFFAHAVFTHRPGPAPWGWLLSGAIVCGTLGALFPRRHRP